MVVTQLRRLGVAGVERLYLLANAHLAEVVGVLRVRLYDNRVVAELTAHEERIDGGREVFTDRLALGVEPHALCDEGFTFEADDLEGHLEAYDGAAAGAAEEGRQVTQVGPRMVDILGGSAVGVLNGGAPEVITRSFGRLAHPPPLLGPVGTVGRIVEVIRPRCLERRHFTFYGRLLIVGYATAAPIAARRCSAVNGNIRRL
ncbi:LLM class F420-dependent oxidoreductase [Babesia caballi]|uniref:LLM class F420-dependent oxidoreductase n=1 Tax=Babesia caballi TaxID=5871 RepID=A0AAV4M0D3_BABCB|nr:LLM class F420-dependent oxidoreductase [Babesia caballi]